VHEGHKGQAVSALLRRSGRLDRGIRSYDARTRADRDFVVRFCVRLDSARQRIDVCLIVVIVDVECSDRSDAD